MPNLHTYVYSVLKVITREILGHQPLVFGSLFPMKNVISRKQPIGVKDVFNSNVFNQIVFAIAMKKLVTDFLLLETDPNLSKTSPFTFEINVLVLLTDRDIFPCMCYEKLMLYQDKIP